MKLCKKCGELKEINKFCGDRTTKDGIHPTCRSCKALYAKTISKSVLRARHLKYIYGMTPEQHDLMFQKQGGKCAVCKLNKKLDTDHQDTPFKVRGLLCRQCNNALGLIKESFDTAINLAKYIQEHRGTE